MRKLILPLIVVLFSMPAHAQTNISSPECQVLPEHKASADVAYQPGVDVHGKPVVPADLNAPSMGLGQQNTVVPLTIDLAQRLQGQNIAGLKLDATQGFLEISPDGRVTYNGQDLTSQVYVLCGKKPPEPLSTNGQSDTNILEYAPVKENKPAAVPVTPPAPAQTTPPAPKVVPKKEPAMGELLEGGESQEEGLQ